MFKKILIANRGEIACRIIKTAKRLAIQTVAVYSEADKQALHVKLADEAYFLGPAPSRESYLSGEKILAIAKKCGAEAIHPGYGFLSENAGFAAACRKQGVIFIGPPEKAIESMGSKSAAKAIAEREKVPLIPGYYGADQNLATLISEAKRMQFPLLIKAAMGGGGKGMRVVLSEKDLEESILAAQREALSSFGDGQLLLEKYLPKARHIELQIFADQHGQVISLFERDCSIQRRHQKILEEAPAPTLSNSLREKMVAAAIRLAKAIDYQGAGTLEFLVEDEAFFFMEMNTRLQVEHPVTEKITGLDLVEWQLRIASGEKLPLTQEQLHIDGHAIEARIYAENPEENFLPSMGTLDHLIFPIENENIRIDSGVQVGDSISHYYDPMIAKLIVWDKDRQAALRQLEYALTQIEVVGVKTNVDYLKRIIKTPEYQAGDFSTRYVEEHPELITVAEAAFSYETLAAVSTLILQRLQNQYAYSNTYSPWKKLNAWQSNLPANIRLYFTTPSAPAISIEVAIEILPLSKQTSAEKNSSKFLNSQFNNPAEKNIWSFKLNSPQLDQNYPIEINAYIDSNEKCIRLNFDNSRMLKINFFEQDAHLFHLFIDGHHVVLHHQFQENSHGVDELESSHDLKAPMPGTIISMKVSLGQQVKRGDALCILEAMKMEHTIYAPFDGTVTTINHLSGEMVSENNELMHIEPLVLA